MFFIAVFLQCASEAIGEFDFADDHKHLEALKPRTLTFESTEKLIIYLRLGLIFWIFSAVGRAWNWMRSLNPPRHQSDRC